MTELELPPPTGPDPPVQPRSPEELRHLSGRLSRRLPPHPERHRPDRLPVRVTSGRQGPEVRRAGGAGSSLTRPLCRGTSGELESLPAEERARRERARETGGGIVRFSCDDGVSIAVFDLAGRLFADKTRHLRGQELPARSPVVEPRIDPTGRRVAYVSGGDLRLIGVDGSDDRSVLESDDPEVTYGLAEFVAGEEMGRSQGYWWSPDGSALLVARVDNNVVERRYISDPATPTAAPQAVAYPAAGTPNAVVTLDLVKLGRGRWRRRPDERVSESPSRGTGRVPNTW